MYIEKKDLYLNPAQLELHYISHMLKKIKMNLEVQYDL